MNDTFIAGINKEKAREILPAFLLLFSVSLACTRSLNQWFAFSAVLIATIFFFRDKIRFENDLWTAFLFCVFVSSFFSLFPAVSLWKAWIYCAGLAVFFAAGSARPGISWNFWLGAVFSAATFFSVLALLGPDRLSAFSPNPNYAASFLGSAASGCFYFLVSQEAPRGRKAAAAGLAVFVFAIAAVNSRGAALGFLTAAFAILLRFRMWKKTLFFALLLMLAAAILPEDFIERFLKLDSGASYQRINIWKTALEAFLRKPLFGWGAEFFKEAFGIFKFPFFNGISYYGHETTHAHSEILNILAENGFTAALLFAAAFARSAAKGPKNGRAAASFMALSVFVQGTVDVVLYSGAVLALFFGNLGFAANFRKGKTPGAAAVLAFSLFFAGAFAFQKKYADARYGEKNAEELRSLALLNVRDRDLLAEILKKEDKEGNAVRLAAVSGLAGRLYPKSVFFKFDEARAALMTGNPEKAEAILEEILRLEPGFRAARVMLAEALAARGETARALEELRKVEKENAARKAATLYDMKISSVSGERIRELKKRAGAGIK